MLLNQDCTVLRNLGQRMSHGPYCANDDNNNLIRKTLVIKGTFYSEDVGEIVPLPFI